MAVGFAVLWGVWGVIYFVRTSKKQGKEIMIKAATA
jgi:hypothetical protein